MKRIIETKRLILRELNVSDSIHFYRLNADPEVLRYTGDLPFSSVTEAESFLKSYQEYEINGFGRWAVISKASDSFLGWCGLKLNEEGQIDLGFRFFQKEWGKGYATEAAFASLNHGFNDLHVSEIIGRISSENKASIRVLEKLGMRFWNTQFCQGIEKTVYYRIHKKQFMVLHFP